MPTCFFNGCKNASVADTIKCLFHSHRGCCLVQDCHNQVYARNLCVRHGGKRQCAFDGCQLNSRVGAFCTRHSPSETVRRCSEGGCSSQAHLRGKCFRHGGSRLCKADGCATYARNRGFCARHTPPPSSSLKEEPSSPSSVSNVDVWTLDDDHHWMQQALLTIEPTMEALPGSESWRGWSEINTLLADV
ncbi:Aste57867_9723 [Aphanomyces stellatus]|uniref:Aste57867_9723 protein n=1 Tax=Aphanomyces stellatus TaxID=120398 RepID=A0A485KP65_9STRA|nr:hypothetical protein As57867_009685 [Aphanomyces stellatus]VFT86602.1 Aste57867_9723 [Aphanomyces stellatus]